MPEGILVEAGHDRSGTTATRPTNAPIGFMYYNTTTNSLQVVSSTTAGVSGWSDTADYGSQSNTAGDGFDLSVTGTALGVFTDDGGNSLDTIDNARGIRSRMLLTVDQDGSSLRAIQGQLKINDTVDFSTGIYTAVQGYVELAGDTSAETGSTLSCFDASLEIPSAKTLTIDSGGEACGIHVETTGAGTITNNGTCAGILITQASGAPNWPVGLAITSDCTEGILVSGACTDGIKVTGACTSAQIEASGTAVLAAGEQAIYVNVPLETVATNGIWVTLGSNVTTGDLSGVRSKVTSNSASSGANPRAVYAQSIVGASLFAATAEGILATVDVSAGGCTAVDATCVAGHFATGATATITNLCVGKMRAQTRGDENVTGIDCLLKLENQAVSGNGRQMDSYLLCTPTNLGGAIKGAGFLIDGGTDTSLLGTAVIRLPADSATAWDTAADSGDTESGAIKVVIGTATRYIQLYSDPPVD